MKVESVYELIKRVTAELAKPSPYSDDGDGYINQPMSRQMRADLEEMVRMLDDTLPKAMPPDREEGPRRLGSQVRA